MIETVILDLDGPLLDGRLRQYSCYQGILQEHGYTVMAIDDYWQMKRTRRPLQDQLAETGATAIESDFRRSWLERIESEELLAHDTVQPGVIPELERWRGEGRQLVLVTLRQNREGLFRQLEQLELLPRLDLVLACEHRAAGKGKAEQIRKTLPGLHPDSAVWVGDTEVDVEGARNLGCPIYAVTCGVRTRKFLESLGPDHTVDSLLDVQL